MIEQLQREVRALEQKKSRTSSDAERKLIDYRIRNLYDRMAVLEVTH